MAKTLFFIEAFVLAALAVAFPIVASEAAAAFVIPVAVSLVLPLAFTMAVWPGRSVLAALALAFSPAGPGRGPESAVSLRVLEELGFASRASSGLGLLFAVASLCSRPPAAENLRTLALLGIFLSAYALVNVALWRILAAVVSALRPLETALAADLGMNEAFARKFGLTPRERESAALIAAGKSYKVAAYELGISIRTVKVHMSRVYEKTGAATNVGLVLLMRAEGASTTKVR